MSSAIVIVGGPTASGKSALALALAERLGGTIVNADSMQVYRDLRILTARPDAAAEARAPHRLYGVFDAAEACSAARWRALALDEIVVAHAAGRVPILVGGTGLYLHVLLHGLADVPDIPPEIRAEVQSRFAALGEPAFRALVAALDPAAAARIKPGDRQRLIRAFEVAIATGKPLSVWQAQQQEASLPGAAVITLMPPRPVLYADCNARLAAMVEAGALDEVRALLARRLDPTLPAMKAVGVRELAAHVEGRAALPDALAAAQRATRRYAKRQLTWFRHRLPQALRIDAQFSERLLPETLSFIRQFLLTHGSGRG